MVRKMLGLLGKSVVLALLAYVVFGPTRVAAVNCAGSSETCTECCNAAKAACSGLYNGSCYWEPGYCAEGGCLSE
jgi:hypothetical protein